MSHVLHLHVWPLIPTCLTNEVPETTGVTSDITNSILLVRIKIALTIISNAEGAETVAQLVIVSLVCDIILQFCCLKWENACDMICLVTPLRVVRAGGPGLSEQ